MTYNSWCAIKLNQKQTISFENNHYTMCEVSLLNASKYPS